MPDIFDIVGGQLQTATPPPSGDIFDQVAQQLTTPTPTPTPTAVADTGEGEGFLAKINAALGRAREAQPDWLKYEVPWLKAPEEAGRELLGGMIPRSPREYLTQIFPPLAAYEQGKQLAQGDVSSIPFVGRVPEIMQAEETPALSKERYLTAMKTLMDVGMLAGARAKPRIPLRAEPIMPPEPTLAERITQPRVEDANAQLNRILGTEGKVTDEVLPSTPQEPLAPVTPAAPGLGIQSAFSAKGATDVLYQKAFDALQKGQDTISGVRDPILARHRAAFERGEIRSPEDLKIAEEGKGVGGITPEAAARAAQQPSGAGPPPTEPPITPPVEPAVPEAPAPKTRKFSLQLQADTDLIQNLKDKIGNRTYEPIPNKITADQAVNLVDERPIPDVINAVKDEANGVPGHVRSAMGQIVIKRLNRAAESLGQAGKTADADIAMNQAVNLAEWMQEFGTRSGQTVQSFAMWSALTPEGKLISVSRKVHKARANFEHENPGEVSQITDALNLPTEAEQIAAFKKLFKTNKTARKAKPRMQRLIEAARTDKLTDKEFYDIASDRLGLPRYDPMVAGEIMRLAQEIDRLPEGMPRDEATLKLNKFIATKMGFRLSDLPMGVYYGNMLSGYNTHIVNALDTFLNVGSELSGMAISNPRSALKIFGNSLKGFNEGRADALMALSRGRMLTNSRWMEIPRLMEVAKFGEKGGVPPLGKGLAGRVVTRLAESKVGYPLNAWKYVGRLMSASDSIMFRAAKEGRAALLADRLARSEGLRGKALNRRVQEELGRTTEQETLFRQQAKDEGFSGAAETARINELRERSRSMEANADADDFAGIATYNHKPQGVLGYVANKVGEASNQYPALRTIVPFTNIVANVTNRGLNYTPWGFKRAFRGYSGELPPKGDARRVMLARATMGSTGLGLLYTLQQQGAVEIHGAGPSDPDKRKQLQEVGWRPYSIKMGDHYLSYLPTPLGLGLSILGNMSDVQRYGEMDQKSALLRGTYALTRVGSTIFSQSFLSSLSTLFEALSGQSPGQQLSAWRRLTSGIAGTVTTPRIVTDVQRIFDPKRYESNTIAGDLLKNTPFSAMVNRPVLNAFGEPVEPPTNRFISAASDDPAWRVIADANLRVPVPDKYTVMPDGRGGKRQISPEEYYEYLEKSGPLVKQYIMRDTFNLTKLPPDKAQDLLSKKSQEIRERVLKDIRRRAQFTPAD